MDLTMCSRRIKINTRWENNEKEKEKEEEKEKEKKKTHACSCVLLSLISVFHPRRLVSVLRGNREDRDAGQNKNAHEAREDMTSRAAQHTDEWLGAK